MMLSIIPKNRLLSSIHIADLFSTMNHSDDFNNIRAENVDMRLQLITISFGVMTLFWILIDYYSLDREYFVPILWLRIAIAISMIALGLWNSHSHDILSSRINLSLLIFFPGLLYMASQYVLEGAAITDGLTIGYTFLPYLMVGILAIFPLTILEGAGYTALIAMFTLMPHVWSGEAVGMAALTDLWLLGLLAGICVWPSMSQLHMLLTLYRQATCDPLTDLGNRRILMNQLTAKIADTVDSGGELSILLLDLDRFKRINDIHGHLIGDEVLINFSSLLKRSVRPTDFIGRYGGEEFVVILPNTGSEQAVAVAEKINKSCREQLVPLDRRSTDNSSDNEKYLSYTVSIGIAQLHNGENNRSLIGRADESLYHAKNNGRDCIILASS